MRPLQSIITVVLNGYPHIAQCIESVVSQKTDSIEFIVIDGGSTDGTLDVINAHRHSIDAIISEPDSGVAQAFNKGIALARGDFVAFLNADDYYEPDALNLACQRIDSSATNTDVFYGAINYVDDSVDVEYGERPNLARIWDFMSLFHPATFVRKQLFAELGEFSPDYRFAMDSEWFHRAITQGALFAELDFVVANMRIGGLSNHHLAASLWEFRRSVAQHRGETIKPLYYFARQYLLHSFIKLPAFKRLLLARKHRMRAEGFSSRI
ncbi:MAG: glycosyltransferase family 2 protein [Pseudomonadales bacterium]